MKIISKLTLLVCAVAAAFNISVSGEMQGVADNEIQQEFELLSAIGIFTDETFNIYESDEYVQRKELASVMCRLTGNAGMLEALQAAPLTAAPFPDVPVNDEDAAAIKLACDTGIMQGYDSGLFGPEDAVGYEQAAKVIVSALGCDLYAQKNGGYPSGYVSVAAEKGIINGVGTTMGSPVTKRDFAHMLYNALDADIMKKTGTGTNSVYETQEGKTLLSEYLRIEKGKGIINATSQTGLSTDNMLNNNDIQIDSEVFKSGKSDAENYLGYKVTYYAADDDESGEKILLYVKNEQKPNDELVIQAGDIDESATTREKLVYWEDNNSKSKQKEIKLSPVADMIYNGKAYPSFTKEELIPESGYVKLLDRDADGKADVIFVTSYEIMVVDRVSEYTSVVYNKYSHGYKSLKSIELDKNNSSYSLRILKDGTEIGIEEIKEWDVLSVAVSKNSGEKRIEVQVCSDVIDAALNSIENENTIIADDTEYKLSKAYITAKNQGDTVLKEIKAGQKLTLRLDIFGEVAFADSAAEDGEKYAYLFKMYIPSGSEDEVMAKILTDSGKWTTLRLAKNVSFNGTKCKPEQVLNKLAIIKKKEVVHLDRQMILYELNGNGEIKTLKTAKSFDDISDSDLKSSLQLQSAKNDEFWVREQSTKYYRSANRSFGSAIYLRSDLKIFIIPTETYADDEEKYFVEDVSYLRNDNSYTFTSYAEDEYQYTSVIMINDDISLASRTSDRTKYNNLYVVDKSAVSMVGDDVIQQLYGVVANQENISVNGNSDSIFDLLRRGDIIQLRFDRDGRVDDFFKVYKVSDGRRQSNASIDADGSRVIVYGNVVAADIAEKRIKVNDGKEKVFSFSISTPAVTVYDHDSDTVSVGTVNDIETDDFVIMRITKSKVADVVVYKNY